MPTQWERQATEEHILAAYDNLTIALNKWDLMVIRSTRRAILDLYWLVRELPTAEKLLEEDQGEAAEQIF